MGTGIEIAVRLLESPAVQTAVLGAIAWAFVALFERRTGWIKYKGYIIAAVKWAEKTVPDTTENKSLKRMDEALKRFIQLYEIAENAAPSATLLDTVRAQISVVHDQLESEGTL
mgnify:CR=1 FL=1|jgi:hypothetical protein